VVLQDDVKPEAEDIDSGSGGCARFLAIGNERAVPEVDRRVAAANIGSSVEEDGMRTSEVAATEATEEMEDALDEGGEEEVLVEEEDLEEDEGDGTLGSPAGQAPIASNEDGY
jgi:hypothetical protein